MGQSRNTLLHPLDIQMRHPEEIMACSSHVKFWCTLKISRSSTVLSSYWCDWKWIASSCCKAGLDLLEQAGGCLGGLGASTWFLNLPDDRKSSSRDDATSLKRRCPYWLVFFLWGKFRVRMGRGGEEDLGCHIFSIATYIPRPKVPESQYYHSAIGFWPGNLRLLGEMQSSHGPPIFYLVLQVKS